MGKGNKKRKGTDSKSNKIVFVVGIIVAFMILVLGGYFRTRVSQSLPSDINVPVNTQPVSISFSAEDVEEAEKLALADAKVQAWLQSYDFPLHKPELIITHIRVSPPATSNDPCRIDLCFLLSFNTETDQLYEEVVVNLTTRKVEIK